MTHVPYLPTTLLLDAYDTRLFGFVLARAPQARDVVAIDLPAVAVVEDRGLTMTARRGRLGERRFTLTGTLLASTVANLQAAYRELHYRAAGGARVLTLVDDSARQITAWLTGISFTYLGPDGGSEAATVELTWRALDPAWESTSATTVNLTTTPAACALGTVESWPVITVAQSCTVTYKNSGGTTLATIVVTGVTGSQTATIDMRARTITHSVSGVTPSLRTGGRFFALDPYDGSYPTAAWPTLTVSTGTGTAVYRQRWNG